MLLCCQSCRSVYAHVKNKIKGLAASSEFKKFIFLKISGMLTECPRYSQNASAEAAFLKIKKTRLKRLTIFIFNLFPFYVCF